MKTLFLNFLFFLGLFTTATAQEKHEQCQSHLQHGHLLQQTPYFGNMAYLEDIADSVHQVNRNARLAYQRYVYQVPVAAWVYKKTIIHKIANYFSFNYFALSYLSLTLLLLHF